MILQEFKNWMETHRGYSDHSLQAYMRDVRDFQDYINATFGSFEPEKISSDQIKSYLAELMDSGHKRTTISRKLASVKVFFTFIKEKHLLTANPAGNITAPKGPKALPVFLDEKITLKLFDQHSFANDFKGIRDRLILELLYGSGLRVSELTGLNITDIYPEECLVRVLGKGNKERYVPFPVSVSAPLKEYLAIRDEYAGSERALFVTEKGRSVNRQLVYRMTRKYLSLVSDIKKRSPHVLRHTYATHLLNNGASLKAIKDLLGHSSLAATEKYTHVSFRQLKKVHEKTHPRG